MGCIRIRKAILYDAGDLRIDEELYDPATLKPTEILVRTEATGFSTGTDLGNYQGRSTEVPGAPEYPRWVGYSNVGIVVTVGEAVRSLRPGDRVFAAKPHCSAYAACQDEVLIPLPKNIDTDDASLGYLVHLGIAGLRQVNYEAGENICVVGLGVIGLCTVAAARAMGARVVAITNDSSRGELARRLGAETSYESGAAMNSVFGCRGAEVVVLTANTWQAFRDSMEVASKNGRISVLGFPGRAQPMPDFNPLDARWLYGKQLTIRGTGIISRVECDRSEIRFNLRRNLQYVFDLMAAGSLNIGPIISHRFPFERMAEAYKLAEEHSKGLTAAVFDWRHA